VYWQSRYAAEELFWATVYCRMGMREIDEI
jgi:hypothetical protein